MDWKSLADKQRQQLEQVGHQLTVSTKEVGDLRYELAEQHERLNKLAAVAPTATNDGESHTKLQLRLQIVETEKSELAGRVKAAEAQTYVTLQRSSGREHALQQEIASLKSLLAQGNVNPYTSLPHNGHTDNVEQLRLALHGVQTENARLKQISEILQRQLQAEKQSNNGPGGFLSAQAKFCDQDDDEPGLPARQQALQPIMYPYPTCPPVQPPFRKYIPRAYEPAPAFRQRARRSSKQTSALGPTPFAMELVSRELPSPAHIVEAPKPVEPPAPTALTSETIPLRPKHDEPAATIPAPEPTALAKSPPQAPRRNSKRQRSDRNEIDSDAKELTRSGMPTPTTPRKKSCKNLSETPDFDFIAVTEYGEAWQIAGHFTSQDLAGMMEELWERIELLTELWAEKKGQLWQEVLRYGTSKGSFCVTRKLEGGKMQWRPGCEGRYACQDCVAAVRPCLTWDAEAEEFLLLPLHEADRRHAVQEGLEIRFWINA